MRSLRVKNTGFKTTARSCLVLLFYFIVTIIMSPAYTQEPGLGHPTVTLSVNNAALSTVLSELERQIPYRFAFNSDLIKEQKPITIDTRDQDLDAVLSEILNPLSLTYTLIGNQIVIQKAVQPGRITISGYVMDSLTGESLPQAVLYIPEQQISTYTNNYGFYSITLNKPAHFNIAVSYLGFRGAHKSIAALSSATQNFYLSESRTEIQSVVIKKDNPDDNIKKVSPGKTDVSLERLKNVASFGGNGDILGSIQMLPGVLAGLDGRPGYFIRGGNTDQNLIQLDEATLYNPVHLLGLVSIFNSSALKSAYLLKAGFPASFGDHLSSVLDITMREGNSQEFEGDLQLGSVISGVTLSGPVIKNKGSFFVSARKSTIDLLFKPLDIPDYFSDYTFYDINAKLNFNAGKKDRVYLSFYQGRDKTAYSRDSSLQNPISYGLNYGNQAAVLRWNHLFSSRLFMNTSFIFNRYFHEVNAREEIYAARLYSGIRDLNYKTDFYYYPTLRHKISAGINYLYQTQYPSSVTDIEYDADSSGINPDQIPRKYARRVAVYFGDEFRISRMFILYAGARVPAYFTNEAHFIQFEPRLSFMQVINPSTSLKLSYTQMHQFLNRVQSFNSAFPAEIWIGSGKNIKPQNSTEVSIGLFKNFRDNMFQTSLEIYYKKMGNQALFREGAEPAFNSNIDKMLVFGEGKSYGAELYLGKNTGKLTGWIAYTLSKVYQQFDSLNLGNSFPFSGDRRHSLYVSASYPVTGHWRISSNFLFASGSAFTLFSETATYNPIYYDHVIGNETPDMNRHNKVQNNFRLEPYHRLDLSISYKSSRTFKARLLETEWVLSVYNVYARKNTFFAYCSFDPVTQKPVPVQVSFVPVIPSLSFYIRF
ncbi:MAG TPA: carboxypeptidase-like regulatory domain-containing protein [Bacteroidales bacterium]|nr:carboxypeptidase-like regulatory domain-containing protein [Bacteroidales bacterium]